MFFNERFMAFRHENGCHDKKIIKYVPVAKNYRVMPSGFLMAANFKRYVEELVSKPAILSSNIWGGGTVERFVHVLAASDLWESPRFVT